MPMWIIPNNLPVSCQSLDNSRPVARLPRPVQATATLPVSPEAPEIDVLRRGRWFASLPSALQTRISQLAVLRTFRTGQYLLRAGDPPRGMFGLVSGRTRHIYVVGEDPFLTPRIRRPAKCGQPLALRAGSMWMPMGVAKLPLTGVMAIMRCERFRQKVCSSFVIC